MKISSSLSILILLFGLSNLSLAQSSDAHNGNFYSYLKEISAKFDIQFAVTPEVVSKINFVDSKSNRSRENQLNKLGEILESNALSYIILNENKILIRKNQSIKKALLQIPIQGKIKDNDTQENIQYVSIYIANSDIGTTSDHNGNFQLNVPTEYIGRDLIVQFLGYESQKIKITDPQQNISITLKNSYEKIEMIYIYEEPSNINISPLDNSLQYDVGGFDMMTANRFFSSYENQLLSRYSSLAYSSSREGLFIRGANANSLVLMDKIPVYRFDNFYSFLNNYNELHFDHLSIYKNSSPSNYLHNAFGIIDLESSFRKDKTVLNVLNNLFYAVGELNIPINTSKWNLKLSGRKSFTDLDKNPFINLKNDEKKSSNDDSIEKNQQPVVSFYDLNGSLNFKDKTQRFQLSYLKNENSIFSSSFIERSLNRTNIEQNLMQNDITQNTGFAGNYSRKISPTLETEINYAQSEASIMVNTDVITNVSEPNRSSRPTQIFNNSVFNEFESKEMNIGMKKILNNAQYSISGQYINYIGNLDLSDEGFSGIELSDKTDIASLGVQARNYWSESINTTFNVNQYLDFNSKKQYTAFKALVNKTLVNNIILSASFARQYQFYNETTLENPFGQTSRVIAVSNDEEIPVSRVNKLMLGFQYQLNNWSLNTELFRNTTNGEVNIARTEIGFRVDERPEYFIDIGESVSQGIDLSIDYRNKNYNSSIEYTLSKSTVIYDKLYNSVEVPSVLDRRHQLNWSQHYNHNKWNFSIVNSFLTGTPFIDFKRLDANGPRNQQNRINTIINRLPNYYSLDLSVGYRFKLFGQRGSISATLINSTNHENISSIIQSSALLDEEQKQINLTTNNKEIDRQLNLTFSLFLIERDK